MTKVTHQSTTPASRPDRVVGAPRGPRKHEARSDALLDAAAALFVEKGMASTTIDDIAERACVAKGTFYHYFPDRVAMLSALHDRYSQHFADISGQAMDACGPDDLQARLNAWVTTIVDEYIATYALHDAIFHDPSVCHRCAMSEQPFIQILAELIDQGKRQGLWFTDDSLSLAVCMFHAVHGMVDEAITLETDVSAISPFLSRTFANTLRPA